MQKIESRRRGTVAALVVLLGAAGCGGGAGAGAPESPKGTPSSSTSAQQGGGGGKGEIVQFALGDFHSCAVVGGERAVWCWGRDRAGELGDGGSGGDRHAPVKVAGMDGVEEVAAGADFSCARLRDKSVRCWGSGRIVSEAQQATPILPTTIAALAGAVELRAGGYVLCARLTSGEVRCVGNEDAKKNTPTGSAVELAVAATHACARMADATVRCWGEGPWTGARGVSFADPKLAGVRGVSTGDSFACALLSGNQVQCWGRNDQGELGTSPDEDNHQKALAVRGMTAAPVRLSSAESHTCALMPDASLVCWGANTEGELARGTRTTQELAGAAQGLGSVVDFAIGTDHGCAKTRDGSLYCWGGNRSGQLGDGSTERRLSPAKVQFEG